ncbi:MAG: bifunctional acetate--CoA ligase family protein/GNAT family N-acetyltransferase [Deltaproteobacteria bacterium]|jgi:acetyltransferase|nr:bifunctional acetate--CoA ligase family protein/GNAT family N-acetyltransferase [Deltaproteobacteria bacterium]
MSIDNMDKIFRPESIAVVGASERKGSVGAALMHNLIERGFPGEVYPINPRHKKLWQRPACPSIKDLKTPVDLAVIATPIASAPHLIAECGDAGVGGAVIISAGGKEIGPEGRKLEASILGEAKRSGVRIIGPNCIGIVNSRAKLNASFASQMPPSGKMAFLSQSGAIFSSILDLSIKENIGFSYFVSLGSMLDIDFGDMIDYLGGQPEVSSIVMYIESLTRFRNFMSAARAVSRVKPIIALKAGRSAAGALAAASHTGALAGEDSVYDAALKRAGILRVKTFEELFDCAELVAKQPKPRGADLAVITNAGGPGVMAADTLSEYGHEPVTLSAQTLKQLDEILPPYWSRRNPIDMLGEATPELYRQVVEICLKADEVNGILILSAPQALTDTAAAATALVSVIRDTPIPVITSWIGGDEMQKGRDIFNRAGIPTFDTPERAVRAFIDIYRYARTIEMLQEIPSRFPGKLAFDRPKAKDLIRAGLDTASRLLTETQAKQLLSAYGIPVDPVEAAESQQAAVRAAETMGYPVVLKINSVDISHKSDAKGVRLDLKNAAEVRNAFDQIIENARMYNPEAAIDGVTIQPMRKRPHYELIMGAKQDRDFGPVILFGMGGVMTEVFKDRAIALPPLNRLLAQRLMEETRVNRLLRGYRDIPPANIALLEEILTRLSQLVTDFSEIAELDINPLFVDHQTACAVDARVLLKPPDKPAPHHLVISPYPDQFEAHTRTSMGVEIFVRPIRPEDAPLLVALFESLSPRSVYLRFFTPMKRLPHSMLALFTQIDYDRHIALVALSESESEEQMLGVARIIFAQNLKEAEFSVVVGDRWQGRGIGAALLQRCLKIAEDRGLESVTGVVLAENTQMLALGKKLGFKATKVPDAGEYELSKEFRRS